MLPLLQFACKVLGYHSEFDARGYGKQTELQGTVEQVDRPACSFLLPQEVGGWESDRREGDGGAAGGERKGEERR